MTDPTPPESNLEPSMEEILASIRQIISEDLASTAAADGHPRATEGDDDLLILKDRAPPEPSPFAPPGRPEPATADPPPTETETAGAETSQSGTLETHSPETETPETETLETETPETGVVETETAESRDAEPYAVDTGPAVEPEPIAARSLTVAPSAELAVVDPATAAVVAASFKRLSSVVENKPPPSPPFPISAGGGATLEDITRDILTPVIKAWLDENLPDIVRARVDEEVERITRSRVR